MSSDEDKVPGQHPASDPGADEVCTPPSEPSPARTPRASTRDMILERRSRFIAAALASAGLASAACGGRTAESAGTGDGTGTGTTTGTSTTGTSAAGASSVTGPYMEPQVCLSQLPPEIHVVGPVAAGAGGTTQVPSTGGAQVCLSMVIGGAPQVCLSGGAAPVPPTETPDAGVVDPGPEEPDGGS